MVVRTFIMVVLGALASISAARSQAPPILPFSMGAQPGPAEVAATTQARIKELASDSVPKNESALSSEIARIEAEIANVTAQIAIQQNLRTVDSRSKSAIERLRQSRSALASSKCDDGLEFFNNAVQSFQNIVNEIKFTMAMQDVDSNAIQMPFQMSMSMETCRGISTRIAAPAFNAGFEKFISDVSEKSIKVKSDADRIADSYNQLLENLKTKRNKLRDTFNSTPEQQISSQLPWILSVLGISCVLAIGGVRLFSDEIQMEWVASGQVIQFVTVMVLLSVVTALALSNKLTENTLGTLLGGVAGYVLAQGVGRAAARDVTRGAKDGADKRDQAKP